ncbi:hypothetical protein [Streptomyces sp. NPDC057386]
MTVKLSTLTDAAADWDEMAKRFKSLDTSYMEDVQPVASRGGWQGISATVAAVQFANTRSQLQAAQTEAKAIASLLRDAHQQFTTLVGNVKSLVQQAQMADMTVNNNGEVVYDESKLASWRHDPDYSDVLSKQKAAAAAWTKKIKEAVKAVDDADQGVELALREAAGVKSWFGRMIDDVLGEGHSFNGSAVGDIEVYEARQAKYYADQVLSGEELTGDDLKEWERLMRDNSRDKVFSRTYLDSLGVDNVLKLSNKMDDLAYFDDTKNKNQYLQINGGLSDSLATATRVPDFKSADGKHLRYGTKEYFDAFDKWLSTDDARFYTKWRNDLREYGDDKYDLKVAGEKIQIGRGSGQEVRGYQSLVTLMQQGHGYSPQFVADITDDMIALEKEDPDVWDLRGHFSGKEDGWFANDPVDGALGVMSHNPEGAAGYLDPGTSAGKERLDYLLGDGEGSRDWKVTNTTRWQGNIEFTASDELDTDDRKGLGDALAAAAGGVDPNGPRPTAQVRHTDANNRIFFYAMDTLSDQGDDMPESLRDSMAKVMTSHGDKVYPVMGSIGGPASQGIGGLSAEQIMEMTKQVSRSESSYVALNEGMNYWMVRDIHDSTLPPEDTLHRAGHAVGFLEEARYNALKGDKHDYTWDKMWSYHTAGSIVNFVPVLGDLAQRGVDVATSAWIMGEQKRQDAEWTEHNKTTYSLRQGQLDALAEEWYSVNSGWAQTHQGFSFNDGIYDQIGAAANDGNKHADGIAGDQ